MKENWTVLALIVVGQKDLEGVIDRGRWVVRQIITFLSSANDRRQKSTASNRRIVVAWRCDAADDRTPTNTTQVSGITRKPTNGGQQHEGKIINNQQRNNRVRRAANNLGPDEEVTMETDKNSISSRIVRPIPLMEAYMCWDDATRLRH